MIHQSPEIVEGDSSLPTCAAGLDRPSSGDEPVTEIVEVL
jgi:hypothetical protein